MPSVLQNKVIAVTLEFKQQGTTQTGVNNLGNPIIDTVTHELSVKLRGLNFRQVRDMPGVTDANAVFEACLLEPMRIPPWLKVGARTSNNISWAGYTAKARVLGFHVSNNPQVRCRLGDRLILGLFEERKK